MTTTITTPSPFLEDKELKNTPNRIISYLRMGDQYPRFDPHCTRWGELGATPSVCPTSGSRMEGMYSIVISVLIRAMKARANDGMTWPFLLHELSWSKEDDLRMIRCAEGTKPVMWIRSLLFTMCVPNRKNSHNQSSFGISPFTKR